jgi:hypothetical protein
LPSWIHTKIHDGKQVKVGFCHFFKFKKKTIHKLKKLVMILFFAKFLRKAIHKLKIDLSSILATRHTNVQLATKEDYLLDLVYHFD